MRSLYWDGQTFGIRATEVKKRIIFHFQYYNFEDAVTNFAKDMFRKESFVVQTLAAKLRPHSKVLFVFNFKTVFPFALLFYVKKMLRNC